MNGSHEYRISVYLMDSNKRKVLLTKGEGGRLVPFSFALPAQRLPHDYIFSYFRENFGIEIEFIFHQTSLPSVLDPNTVQTIAPFFTQATCAKAGQSQVDFIYLAFSKIPFKVHDSSCSWCRAEDLVGRIAPKHVKRTVKHILQIVQN